MDMCVTQRNRLCTKLNLTPMSVSPSTFHKMWKAAYPNYTIGGDACCLLCAQLQERHSRASATERANVDAELVTHQQHIHSALKVSHDHQHEAHATQSKDLISLAMDYGPSFLSLPLKARLRLDLHKYHPLQVRSSGLYDDGRRFADYLFFLEPWTETANSVISHLHSYLTGLEWPHAKVLAIELDNHSTNKNHTMLAYSGWLISKAIFDEVRLAYGIVGHTHNRMDRQHSPVAHAIQAVTATSLSEFLTSIPAHMGGVTGARYCFKELDQIWDWVTFFKQFIPSTQAFIHNSHYFSITQAGVRTKVWYEDQLSQDAWPVLASPGPEGQPHLMTPPVLTLTRCNQIHTAMKHLGETDQEQVAVEKWCQQYSAGQVPTPRPFPVFNGPPAAPAAGGSDQRGARGEGGEHRECREGQYGDREGRVGEGKGRG